MKRILVLGAGKSTSSLIEYLLDNATSYDWEVTVGDLELKTAEEKIGGHPKGKAIYFNVKDEELLNDAVQHCDLVLSVLPAAFHHKVAKACLKFDRSIITPSYISEKEKILDKRFKEKGLLFLGELGLDPGIDHLSIMETLARLRKENVVLTGLRSFCGALIAPASDNNPWHYKFTWAPMNVVLAGKGTATYLEGGKPKYIPYNRLFTQTQTYSIPGYGDFEAYANRNSLTYINAYGLENIQTFMRGTLRKDGYCEAWNTLIKLGLTDNEVIIANEDGKLTYAGLMKAFVPEISDATLEQAYCQFMNCGEEDLVFQKVKWLGLFDEKSIGLQNTTPAQILCELLQEKWKLEEDDRDMVVMLHHFEYLKADGKPATLTSSLVKEGESAHHTAIADTVGLPMAIAAKLFLTGKLKFSGVHLPLMQEVYEPVLKELANDFGIAFKERVNVL